MDDSYPTRTYLKSNSLQAASFSRKLQGGKKSLAIRTRLVFH
jgi:hypothetical protein